MIRKIVLDNFMAHGHTVIEPAAGLTVLIGPNNCGKSAIIHALEMICYNSEAADYAIRHGTKKATVTIETQDEDGTVHTISWWRKEKTAGYVIDGREISGIGRSKIPDDLHQHLRMPLIESAAGAKEFLLHFGLQKSPIFLLDDPASRAAQFFASATDADKLMQMQKAHQQKTTYAKRDKEKLDDEIAQLDSQLGTMEPLPALSECLGHLEDEYRKLNEDVVSIGSMKQAVQDLDRAAIGIATSALQISALALLQAPPVLQETQHLAHWIHATEQSLNDAARSQAGSGALRPLNPPPELATTDSLGNMIDAIARSQKQDANWHARLAALTPVTAPPGLAETAPLAKLLGDMESSIASAHRLQFRCDALKDLNAAPVLDDTVELRRRIDDMVAGTRDLDHTSEQARTLWRLAHPAEPDNLQPLMDSIEKIDTAIRDESAHRDKVQRWDCEIEQFLREIDQWLQSNPRCHACGQEITAKVITQGGHAHE